MYQINFDSPVHVHFIGIGGISMSGLAEVLLQEGFTISGSDSQRSELTRHLEEKGATVFYGQTADNIKLGIDVVVYTAAIQACLRIRDAHAHIVYIIHGHASLCQVRY